MARNRMSDLKDHLFAALERLGDESLTDEQIAAEAKRAEAIVAVADQITESAKLQLSAARLFAEHGAAVLPHLPQIGKAPEGPAE
jgi:hypothetical protein